MTKVRKDTKGRALKRGETYNKQKNLYIFTYTDSFGKRRCFYARDLMDLRQKEKENLKNTLDGLDMYIMEKADVNYVFDRFIETKHGLKSSTKTNYIYNYNRYIRKGFGKRKISTIRYSDAVLFYKSLINKGLSICTVDGIHSVLHATLQMAVRDNVLRNNPTDGAMIELKREMGRTASRHSLTYEQEKAFLGYLYNNPKEERYTNLFTILFGTGMRIGEAIGLTWADVDFENREISINHNVTYGPRSDNSYKCEFELTSPKTEAGNRVIPMLDKVYEAFKNIKEKQESLGYESKIELAGYKDFVFLNANGNLYIPASINRAIKRIVDEYNNMEIINARRDNREPVIVPRFSCHVTRHTFCSRLCENESNIKAIQEVMGHQDISVTMDIYAEVSNYKKHQIFDELNSKDIL